MSTGPSGTVTLVFTDIQDSSRLWERHGRLFEPVLALHNKLMRDQIAAHGGYEVKTEGDAFMVAFGESADALRFCVGAQQALESAGWPDGIGAVLVRMGVHSGEPIVSADPRTGRTDYFGPMVNRAARVAAAGHGGQVLLSEAALKRSEHVIESYAVTDLGEHRLRGLEQPERLFQVLSPSHAAREFPPLNTVSALPTNLPPQASSFIGRQNELAELCELLSPRSSRGSGRHVGTSPGTKLMRSPLGGVTRESSRLVTLVGPGGTGKTRLSVRAGYELIDRFDGGVWFVDLSGATDAAGVAHACAAALGVRLTGKDEPVGALANVLEYRKPALLILDNFEQVAGFAAQTIGVWRQRAPRISFLVTSRAVLGLQGEQQYELAPLTPPPRRVEAASLEQLRACESVALFVERAQEADPRFVLDESNLADVCEICNELDGLPLALELAASRVRMLKPAQMVKRLGRKFELLKSSRRDLSPRQQTMYGAVEWGFELLSEWERAAFLQVCVFREGFLLEAAEAVVDLSAHADAPDVLDALQSLREKSLVRAIEGERETRFLMYRPIHEFGVERWRTDLPAPAQAALARRHALHFADYAWHWVSRIESHDELEALDRLEADRENIVAAVEFAAANALPEAAARAALGLWEVLLVRGPVDLRSRVLDAALAVPGNDAFRVRLLVARARAHQEVGEQKLNIELSRRAIDLARSLPDRARLCDALVQLAHGHWHVSQGEEASAACREAEEISRADGDRSTLAKALGALGIVKIGNGDYEGAESAMAEAENLWRAIGYRRGVAHNVANRGVVLGRLGKRTEAVAAYQEAENIYQEIGYLVGVARMIGNRGAQVQQIGDHVAAAECYSLADTLAQQIGAKPAMISNRGNLGALKVMQGDYVGAMKLYEETLALAVELGNVRAQAELLGKIAGVHFRKREFSTAISIRRQAVGIYAAIGDRIGLVHEYFSIFVSLRELGKFEEILAEANARYGDAVASRNDGMIAGMHGQMALAHAGLGQWDLTVTQFETMAGIFDKADPAVVAGDAIFLGAGIGAAALQGGRLDLARAAAAFAGKYIRLHPAALKEVNDTVRENVAKLRAQFGEDV